jgi:hypothetical protein
MSIATQIPPIHIPSPQLAAPKSDEGGRAGRGARSFALNHQLPLNPLAKKLPGPFDTHMAAGESTQPKPWTFRPDIGPPNIKAKLPGNLSNILLSRRNPLLII